jgi:Helix-turn-helix domain
MSLEPAEPELTDARAMRALAHPVRLSLIDLLGYHESLTATQASELLGESPTNCAFHLRTLAKYGFLREAPSTSRREHPWTLVHRSVRIDSDQADPQAARAAKALVQTMIERWLDRARRVFSASTQVPGWHEATGWSLKHVFMTPAEAVAARREIDQILDRYDDRQGNPALRPPGAHPVEWATFTAPVAEWAPGNPS